MPGCLQGQVILNTRPEHQQAELSTALEQEGARILSFPAIDIEFCPPGKQQQRLAAAIGSYDILLFVSRNAVDGAFGFIDPAQISKNACYGVIGSATRRALDRWVPKLDDHLVTAEPYNSESLLEAPALQRVEGLNILIFRGQQGRNLLGGELEARGAQVEYCEVYQRRLPRPEPGTFDRLSVNGFPTLAILTSNEGMHNLFQLLDTAAADRLRQIPWLLISERMRESALKLGHNATILIAASASDRGIQQTICDWAERQYTPTKTEHE